MLGGIKDYRLICGMVKEPSPSGKDPILTFVTQKVSSLICHFDFLSLIFDFAFRTLKPLALYDGSWLLNLQGVIDYAKYNG